MITLGDSVFIHNTHSTHFGGRWGFVKGFDDNGIFYVDFSGRGYRFSRSEFLTEWEYFTVLKYFNQIINPHNGQVLNTKDCVFEYPDVTYGKLTTYHFKSLLPIQYCDRCGKEMRGSFENRCVDCEIRILQEG